ncbi:MAG: hypothetical protein GF355_09375 [Candidatus Eisenbacteria bacterium]|nr:hypothetical protein [Candidatus Eisenbacteria bacterium]
MFFLTIAVLTVIFIARESAVGQEEAPFGGQDDVAFAGKLWDAIQGYEEWPMSSGVYPGTSPHGKFLCVSYNMVHVGGTPYHVVIKDNFGGEGATTESVSQAPGEYLAAVTVMVQREAGYDPQNGNWYWVKYLPDGSLDKNPKGMELAGRVGKGMETGCIPCHGNAKGGDYFFTNDE